MSALDPSSLQTELLGWYDRSARDLPWRRTRDPYAIWVSEIMLQQTRVEAVTDHYRRFLERFPDVHALAGASPEEVIAAWSGLGYYTRARNLHRGANHVRERHGGEFPRMREAALAIPGIGEYTSAAILSIAYDAPHAVVDGNVARVLARVFRLEPPEDRSGPALARLAQGLLSAERPGDHNQAMMELGATICTPRRPACERCPVSTFCRAHAGGVADRYPSPKPRQKTEHLEQTLLLLEHPVEGLLLERGEWPLLPHLWLPPIVVYGGPAEDAESAWRRWVQARIGAASAGVAGGAGTAGRAGAASGAASDLAFVGRIRHSITYRRIVFHVVEGVLARPLEWDETVRCVSRDGLEGLGRSSILAKALRARDRVAASPRPLGARERRDRPLV